MGESTCAGGAGGPCFCGAKPCRPKRKKPQKNVFFMKKQQQSNGYHLLRIDLWEEFFFFLRKAENLMQKVFCLQVRSITSTSVSSDEV